jgi:hypothetical protein
MNASGFGGTIFPTLLAGVGSGSSDNSKLWSQVCFRHSNTYTSPSRRRDLPQFLMRSTFLIVVVVIRLGSEEGEATNGIPIVNRLMSILDLLCLVVENIWLPILLTCD